MIAFLFIGQGAELPWVAPDVIAHPRIVELVTIASEHCGHDVLHLLARGGRELAQTEVVQPAMVALGVGLTELLAEAGVHPDIVLGHSLGELTAWAAAGGVSAADAVKLAALRGRLMAREARRYPGGMLRVKGDREACDRALAIGSAVGVVALGAHNGPHEWVVAGDEAALARIAAEVPSARFPVVGAWHSPAMRGAAGELEAALRALPPAPLRARFVANFDGRFTDATDIAARLVGQLVHPVRWVDALATVIDAGARRLVAVGPGKMLRALVHENHGPRRVEIVDSLGAVRAAA